MQGTKVTRHTGTEVITRCISSINGDFWNNVSTELSVRENPSRPRAEVRIAMLVTRKADLVSF